MGILRIVIDASKFIIKRMIKDDLLDYAAQLAFYFLLSFFPMLLVIVGLLPYLPFSVEDALNIIRDFAPTETIYLIETNINELAQKNISFLSFGIIVTLWSASNGVNGVINILNRAYEVKETRSFLIQRLLAIVFTFLILFVFGIAMLLPVLGELIGTYIFAKLGLSSFFLALWSASRLIVSSIILMIVFMVVYWLAPSTKINCLSVLPGAIVATIGWEVSSFAFSYYVSNFGNYSATYGSIGAIIVLLLWFYITAIIIVIGGELNAFISKRNHKCNE